MITATKVSVTQTHIDTGTACNGSECPIALAVMGALVAQGVPVSALQVDSCDVTVTVGDQGGRRKFRADLDLQGYHFVESFDQPIGSPERDEFAIAPFEMELTWRELFR